MLSYHCLLPLLTIICLAESPIPVDTSCGLPTRRDLPTWSISGWSADFTTAELGGSLIFALRNEVAGSSSLCFRRGVLSQCFWTAGAGEEDTETYFAYDERAGRLGLNQTWSCSTGRYKEDFSLSLLFFL